MRRSFAVSSLIAVALLVVLLRPGSYATSAQPATPVASPVASAAGAGVVASGLTNPRGLAWDATGTLYVALAGTGGPVPAVVQSPAAKARGPFKGGLTAGVARIVNGCPVIVAGHLPSYVDKAGNVMGVSAVAFLSGQLYALEGGGDVSHGTPGYPSGVYRINPDGTSQLIADLSLWTRTHPVAHVPADYDPDTAAFAMIAGNDRLWIVESNSGQVLTVMPGIPAAVVTRVADLSDGHPVPTGLAPAIDGGVYVGMLTPQPYKDGAAKVIHVAPNGTVSDVWTGLTMVTGVAVTSDGALYAAEMATGNTDQPPYIKAGTGQIVRQTGANTSAVVASGLDFPIALATGPGDALYVSQPAIGANSGEGVVVRLQVASGTPVAVPAATPTGAACAPSTPPAATPEVPASPTAATPVGSE